MEEAGKIVDEAENKTQTAKLVSVAKQARLFHTPGKDAYATVAVRGHLETYRMLGPDFKRWLRMRYFEEFEGTPNREALAQAIALVETLAQY